ncbi:MAG: transcriptional regulator, MucR family [Phenylobacterium sp.]|nr:transcriptional regulator, MucR family [Phenylobacterium sp.]
MADDPDLRKIVAEVAAAYFSNSHVTPSEIPTVVNQIAQSLSAVGAPAPETPAEAAAPLDLTPSQIRKSITRDALISFEDNRPYKTLRRHLAVRGLTPEQYRSKWGLAKDYPMVAPAYSEARSQMARTIGLGSRVTAKAPNVEPAPAASPEPLSGAAEPKPAAAKAEGNVRRALARKRAGGKATADAGGGKTAPSASDATSPRDVRASRARSRRSAARSRKGQ